MKVNKFLKVWGYFGWWFFERKKVKSVDKLFSKMFLEGDKPETVSDKKFKFGQ